MSKKKKKNTSPFITILVIIALIIYALYETEINETLAKLDIDLKDFKTTSKEITEDVKVTFLDVGQADCTLIEVNGENMLIDAGNNADGKLIVKYLQDNNITNFKYVIATHPHEDHIGGMDDIIKNFKITKFYMPDVYTTTKTFETVLEELDKKNMTFTIPKIDETLSLGGSKIKILYLNNNKEDFNLDSIVLKLTYKNISFLFMADAPKEVEKQIQNKDIQADILKVGHHGSNLASSKEFLEKVNPVYGVISVAKTNDYNHPGQYTLARLKKQKINILRTDKKGTIVVTSDGYIIRVYNTKTNTNGG